MARAAPAKTPSRGLRVIPWLVGGAVLLGLVLVISVALLQRHVRQAIVERLPPIAETGGVTASFQQALGAADAQARRLPSAATIGDLGYLYHANNLYEQAATCYAITAELAPSEPKWPYFLAAVRQASGIDEGVVDLLQQVVKLAPAYAPARLKLADLLFKQGHQDAAEKEYRRCLELSPDDPYALLGLARLAVEREQWQQARTFLLQAVEADKAFGPGHRLLATVYERLGDTEEANRSRARTEQCSRFKTAPDPWLADLEDHCYDPTYLLVRADIAKQTFDFQRGLELLRRAAEVAPDNARVHETLAAAMRELNQLEVARQHAQRSVELDPDHEDGWVELGLSLGRAGDLSEAEKAFRNALRLNPESTSAYNGLGMVALRTDAQAAEAFFLKACELSDYRFDDGIENYVGCLVRRGGHDQAIALLRKVIERRPTANRPRLLLCRVYADQGNWAAEIDVLRDGLAHYPYDPRCADMLASCLSVLPLATPETGREAIQYAQIAVDFGRPGDLPDYLNTLACAYARAGDFPRAIATMERAITLASSTDRKDKLAQYAQHLALFRASQPVSVTKGAG